MDTLNWTKSFSSNSLEQLSDKINAFVGDEGKILINVSWQYDNESEVYEAIVLWRNPRELT